MPETSRHKTDAMCSISEAMNSRSAFFVNSMTINRLFICAELHYRMPKMIFSKSHWTVHASTQMLRTLPFPGIVILVRRANKVIVFAPSISDFHKHLFGDILSLCTTKNSIKINALRTHNCAFHWLKRMLSPCLSASSRAASVCQAIA